MVLSFDRQRSMNDSDPEQSVIGSSTEWNAMTGWANFSITPGLFKRPYQSSIRTPFSRECLERPKANRAGRLPSPFDTKGTFVLVRLANFPSWREYGKQTQDSQYESVRH